MQIDPVSLDIIWSRLIGTCREAETGLMRTAFSLLVREMQDMGCALVDTNGDTVASGWGRGTQVGIPVANIMKRYPVETMEPGDVFLTNDPWLGTGHLYDCIMAEPIFYQGKVVAVAGSMAHWPDIGGRGFSSETRSLYEEGLQLPVMKIAKGGQFNEEVLAVIGQNVRLPDEVMGDFRSQLVANNLIRTRLVELMETQGVDDFGALAEVILNRSEAAMRSIIGGIPDGDYENEVYIDGFERPLTIKVKVSIRGTDIHVDYSGTSEQSEWCINSVPNNTYTYTVTSLQSALCPHLPHNSGLVRPYSLLAPLGTILNPRRTVGVNARHLTGASVPCAVLGALSKAVPKQAQAETATVWSTAFTGQKEDGSPFIARALPGGGMGGRRGKDGLSCVWFSGNGRNAPAEVLEHQTGRLMVERREIRLDSGGPGLHRGGCGQVMDFRVVGDGPIVFAPLLEKIQFPTEGVSGGQPGAMGRVLLNGTAIHGKRIVTLRDGDHLSLKTPGGGGLGDPLEREPGLVLKDVVSGLVSPEEAEASYGVRIDTASKSVDREVTRELRRSRRLKRDEVHSAAAN